jgi:hypothetical protein
MARLTHQSTKKIGIANECTPHRPSLWDGNGFAVLYVERRAYFNAVHDTIRALEVGRQVLVAIKRRMDEEGAKREAK